MKTAILTHVASLGLERTFLNLRLVCKTATNTVTVADDNTNGDDDCHIVTDEYCNNCKHQETMAEPHL